MIADSGQATHGRDFRVIQLKNCSKFAYSSLECTWWGRVRHSLWWLPEVRQYSKDSTTALLTRCLWTCSNYSVTWRCRGNLLRFVAQYTHNRLDYEFHRPLITIFTVPSWWLTSRMEWRLLKIVNIKVLLHVLVCIHKHTQTCELNCKQWDNSNGSWSETWSFTYGCTILSTC